MVQPLLGKRVAQRLHHMFLADEAGEIARPPFAGQDLVTHRLILPAQGGNGGEPDPGTCSVQLWLLPSGPDQVHQAAMRGGPPKSLCPNSGLWRREWDSNPRYVISVHTLTKRAP